MGRVLRKDIINEEQLRKEYLENRKSSEEIAKEYHISPSSILRRLDDFNIKKRNQSEKQKVYLERHKHPLQGKHCSEERKRKIGMSRIGKKASEITKIKMSKIMKQIKHTKEWNEKVSKALKGKKKSKEHLDNLKKSVQYRIGKNLEELYGKEKADKIKNKMSSLRRLENNPRWLGGIAYEPYTPEFNIKFKNSIRKRDNQVCMLCGIHREKLGRSLCIHHINYDKLLSVKENCICLCDSCHSKTNSNREYWTTFFQSLLSEKYSYNYSNGLAVLNVGGAEIGWK